MKTCQKRSFPCLSTDTYCIPFPNCMYLSSTSVLPAIWAICHQMAKWAACQTQQNIPIWICRINGSFQAPTSSTSTNYSSSWTEHITATISSSTRTTTTILPLCWRQSTALSEPDTPANYPQKTMTACTSPATTPKSICLTIAPCYRSLFLCCWIYRL